MWAVRGVANQRNKVDFAKSTFITKSAYKIDFWGQLHIFFLPYDSICVFAVVCKNSCKNIIFRVDFVYYFTFGYIPL